MGPAVPPSFAAGLLFISLDLLADHDLPRPTTAAVVAALGASRSQAYEGKKHLAAALPDLVRGPGRPAADPEPPTDTGVISRAALDFLMRNPGAVVRSERTTYSDGYRRFALDLWAAHEVEVETFADAVGVPLGTFKDWLAGGAVPDEAPAAPEPKLNLEQLASLVEAWNRWKGDFGPFCRHVREHLRLPYGDDFIRTVLHAEGVRTPRRRQGRSPDEQATRGAFDTFFAGYQWSADGTPIAVDIAGRSYTFNLELAVDVHTAAATGMSVRDEEDGKAVVETFGDGKNNTGEPPLALLLDNRPSNHTDEVADALGDTVKIRRSPGRPQNGAHVEGAFGLFQQIAPDLTLESLDPEYIAHRVLELVAQTWARTLNHRPRKSQPTRADAYTGAPPPPEEVEAAREALRDLARRQERAHQTRVARMDPLVRELLDEAFAELGLEDPDSYIRACIAAYGIDAVLAGCSVYRSKLAQGTLPEGADARYLLGIVRNIANDDLGQRVALDLVSQRLRAADKALDPLVRRREYIERTVTGTLDRISRFAAEAMDARLRIDRDFWLLATADSARDDNPDRQELHVRVAARVIHGSHRALHRDRFAASRRLAELVQPLA